MDSRFGEGELREVVEAKCPTLKLDRLIAQGVVKEVDAMVYLPKHTIGKTAKYTEKSSGSQQREISNGDFDELSADIGAMLSDTSEQIPGVKQPEKTESQPRCIVFKNWS